MKVQTFDEMIQAGATHNEALTAIEMFRVLRPALKIKRENGRIETTHGDKNILGFYRTIKDIISKEAGIC
jgi:hypothetical protein